MIEPPTSTFGVAAAEYRAANQKPIARRDKQQTVTEIERDAVRAFVFDELWDVSRYAVAAQVAIAAGDDALATESMRCIVLALKPALKAWERHETAKPESEAAA